MEQLLAAKDKLQQFYGKYSIYIDPVIKFCVGFLAFWIINNNIGFMERLKTPLIPVVMGLVASIVPYGVTAFLAGCFAVAHISQVSIEAALILLIVILIAMLLYYSLRPGDGYLLLLMPIMFFLKIPYVVPILVGLSGSLMSVIPISCGICIYFIFDFVKENAAALAGGALADIAARFPGILEAVFADRLMWVMIASFAAALLIVFVIKNLSVDYAWLIATGAGIVVELSVLFGGVSIFDLSISLGSVFLGIVAAAVIALVYQFFVFDVDYSRTEYLEYEDDDYIYYVKAVPKIVAQESEDDFYDDPEEDFYEEPRRERTGRVRRNPEDDR